MNATRNRHHQPIELSSHIQEHLSCLAVLHYTSLEQQYNDMIAKFLTIEPWSAWPPLAWRKPPLREISDTVIAHVQLENDLKERMYDTIDLINRINRHTVDHNTITPRTFIYTAIAWRTTYVHPTPQLYPSKP